MMMQCWSESPAKRPTFEEINSKLNGMQKSNPEKKESNQEKKIENPDGIYLL